VKILQKVLGGYFFLTHTVYRFRPQSGGQHVAHYTACIEVCKWSYCSLLLLEAFVRKLQVAGVLQMHSVSELSVNVIVCFKCLSVNTESVWYSDQV